MRGITKGAIGAAAMLAFGMPAAANAQWSRHNDQHERLDGEHGDVHDELVEEHAEAHDQGLRRGEHRRLHRHLDNQHEQADYAIQLQHQREHLRNEWRRRYGSYGGYGGYRGYRGYDYQGYGYQGYGYRPQSGFSLYIGN